MSQSILIASGKGGVGKSVLTAAIGTALARRGASVVIIDADIGLRSQDAFLGLENSVVYDLIDVVSKDCRLEDALLECPLFPGLMLLPASQFARVRSLDCGRFRKILKVLKESFDFVLIDSPAGIEKGLRNLINAGPDMSLLIVTPDDISVRSAERAVQLMESKKLNRPALIVNRLNADLVRSREMMSARTVAEVMDLRLLGEVPEDDVVSRAMLRHSLMIAYDCEARNAILRIASRIKGGNPPFPAYGCRKQSWLKRLFTSPVKEVIPIDDH